MIDKEENPILPDWTANVAAELIQAQRGPGQARRVVDPRIRVQLVVAQLFENAAVKLVGAAPCDETHLHRAFTGGIRSHTCGRYGDFFNRAQAQRSKHKVAGAAALESLRVVIDSVERNIL